MISRKSAKLITNAFLGTFSYLHKSTSSMYSNNSFMVIREKAIYEFFYERDYDVWFLKKIQGYTSAYYENFRTLLLGIHTGESIPFAPDVTPERKQQISQQLLTKLATDIINLYETTIEKYGVFGSDSDARKNISQLKSQLELDGYIYREGTLFPVESSVVDTQAEQSYLETLVDSLGLSDSVTIKHHIKLSEEHYVNGRYSDSIGNSRHFLEAILAQVLEQVSIKLGLNLNPAVYKNATTTRDHLELNGLLITDEKETLKKIYGLLSNTGGHAYIAQKDQARLMWHLALTCSQFVLLRYEGFLKANP